MEGSALPAAMVKQEPDIEEKKREFNHCSSSWLGASFQAAKYGQGGGGAKQGVVVLLSGRDRGQCSGGQGG